MRVLIAISPCPNDTYLFYAWLHNKIPQAPHVQATFAPIETLNQYALTKKYDLIKVSSVMIPQLIKEYHLLTIGHTISYQGPVLLSLSSHQLSAQSLVGLPGTTTTAYHLFDLFFPQCTHRCTYPFDQLITHIETGTIDAGVIIHETRFSFPAHLTKIADLGELWYATHQVPIPLGCLMLKKTVPQALKEAIVSTLHSSLALASLHDPMQYRFMSDYAQGPDIHEHVKLYVNQDTSCLSPQGLKALKSLTHLHLNHEHFFPCS